MGKISKRVDSDGRTIGWQYRWRDPRGDQKKKNFDRKAAAEDFALKTEGSLRDNTYVDPVKGKETFESFATRWHTSTTRSPNYQAGVASTLRLHVFPVIGGRSMTSISEDDIQALVKSLTDKGFVASTVRNYMTLVRTIFKAAVRQKVVGSSPCEDVTLPKGKATKVRPLEPIQVGALIANIEPRYRALLVLGAATGGRQGELFGLRTDDLTWDPKAPSVHFREQLQVERERGIVVRPLKDYEDRIVPIPIEALNALAQHINAFPPSSEGYIFTRPGGGLMHARMFNARPWSRARKAAAEEFDLASRAYGSDQQQRAAQNVTRSRQLAKAGMHDLRDYYVSLLIKAGASVTSVSALLGHSSQSTTLRHYAHLWDDHEEQARSIVGENLRSIIPAVP